MIAHKDDLPRPNETVPPRVATYRWGLPPSWKERAGERRERLMTTLDEERRMLADRRLASVG